MLESNPTLNALASFLPDPEELLRVIRRVHIIPAFSVKLTIARNQDPWLYDHLIKVTIAAVWLGMQLKLKKNKLINLATAALFHDLGELHFDSKYRDHSYRLTLEDKIKLSSHPLVMKLILDELPEYHPSVGKAILDHHERLDGTGYPQGKSAKKIHEYGRILATSELAVILMEKRGPRYSMVQLITALKLNVGKYGSDLLNHFIQLNRNMEQGNEPEPADSDKLIEELIRLRDHLFSWIDHSGRAQELAEAKSEATSFVDQRLSEIQRNFVRAGIMAGDLREFVDAIEEEPEVGAELRSMCSEFRVSMHEIYNEVGRRWPTEFNGQAKSDGSLTQQWICDYKLKFLSEKNI